MAKKIEASAKYGTKEKRNPILQKRDSRYWWQVGQLVARPLEELYKTAEEEKAGRGDCFSPKVSRTVAEYCEKWSLDAISKGIFSYDAIYLWHEELYH